MDDVAEFQAEASRASDIRAQLRRLERRDWWFWALAVVVTLGLTVTVVVLAIPLTAREADSAFQVNLSEGVHGLVALVLIFNIYSLYQQYILQRLRRRLLGEQLRLEEFEKLAMFDPLTGLYNRRIAERRLPEEIARAQRSGKSLAVLALDMNDFKQINDRYGHPTGDRVLQGMAQRMQRSIRFSDIPVRMGGDEFMVMLPECQPEQVQIVIERMGPVEVYAGDVKVHATYAAGWACYQPGEQPQQLLDRADQALYAQKHELKQKSLRV